MRKIIMATSALTVMTFGGSLVMASAASPGQNYDVSGFDSVSEVGPHNVVIQVGPSASVRADGPQESLDLMEVVVEDGELKIVPRHERWDWGDWDGWHMEPATYYVTLPSIKAAAVVGSGGMTIDRVDGKRFSGSIAGSAKLEIARLTVDDARFSVAGSGDLVPHGSVRHASFSIAGSGNVHAKDLTSESAQISIAGSGNADLAVRDDAHVSLVGSGDVEITGGAHCTVSAFGSGQARCNGAVVEDSNGRNRWGMWGPAPPAPPAPNAPRWNWGPWGQWNGWDDRDHRRSRKDRDVD